MSKPAAIYTIIILAVGFYLLASIVRDGHLALEASGAPDTFRLGDLDPGSIQDGRYIEVTDLRIGRKHAAQREIERGWGDATWVPAFSNNTILPLQQPEGEK